MPPTPTLQSLHPWCPASIPLITLAPMRLIAGPALATSVSLAGGLGFLGCGTDPSLTEQFLASSKSLLAAHKPLLPANDPRAALLPVGVGYLLWAIPDEALHSTVIPALVANPPLAVWLYAPRGDTPAEWLEQLALWTSSIRSALPSTAIWLQLGSVHEACTLVPYLAPDVLVVQGGDAGGHGLNAAAGLLTLLPDVLQALETLKLSRTPHVIAAGGLATPSQVLACSILGAAGVALGTAFLPTPEAVLAPGYRKAVLRAADGGQSTVRSGVYDYLRGTRGWPARYGGRGIANGSYTDWTAGKVPVEENERLYKEAEAKAGEDESVWGEGGRMCAYAGTGVGLVTQGVSAGQIVKDLHEGYLRLLEGRPWTTNTDI